MRSRNGEGLVSSIDTSAIVEHDYVRIEGMKDGSPWAIEGRMKKKRKKKEA